LRFVIRTGSFPPVILIRAMVGLVFVSEGVQKLLYPTIRGGGRFLQMGLPSPEILGYLVGGIEILCGLFVLVGLLTRMCTIPLMTIMVTALLSTKSPILIDSGFWEMAHLARMEFAMLMSCLFLLIIGPSDWSIDMYMHRIRRRRQILSKSVG